MSFLCSLQKYYEMIKQATILPRKYGRDDNNLECGPNKRYKTPPGSPLFGYLMSSADNKPQELHYSGAVGAELMHPSENKQRSTNISHQYFYPERISIVFGQDLEDSRLGGEPKQP